MQPAISYPEGYLLVLGSAYFDPQLDSAYEVFGYDRKVNGIADFQRDILIHEYNHLRYNFTHVQIANKWGLTNSKGVPFAPNENDEANLAMDKFLADDCNK